MHLFLFFLLSALYFFVMASWLTHAHLGDFYVYLTAAQALHQSVNPYLTLQHWHLGPERLPSIYFYPPFLIIILEKLLFLGTSLLRDIWINLSILCIPMSALFLGTALTKRTSSFIHIIVLALLAFHPATYDGLYFGQVDCFVLLLLSIVLYFILFEKKIFAGIALGLGVALKLSPVYLGFSLLGKGWLKSMLALVIVVAGSLLLSVITPRGSELLSDFSTALSNLSSGQYFFGLPGNLSFAKLLMYCNFGLNPKEASFLSQILALVLASALVLRLKLHSANSLAHIFSGSILCMILASPITWYHHLVWILIPHFWIIFRKNSFFAKLVAWIALLLSLASLPVESYLATTTYPEAAEYLGALLVSVSLACYLLVIAVSQVSEGQKLRMS